MSTPSTLTVNQLKQWLDEGRDFLLVDTAPPEVFAEAHLPGAQNACIYDVRFLDLVTALGTGKPIVVYGHSASSLASQVAAERLARAGRDVHDFRGGLEEWTQAVGDVEGSGTKPHPAPSGEQPIDTATSLIEWTGRNLANKHHGNLKLKSGSLDFAEGQLTGGRIVIDMTSIACTDIPDAGLAQVLVNHLKHEDFFLVDELPEAVLTLTKVEAISGATPGIPNLEIAADLTLRGVTSDIEFTAAGGITAEGTFVAQANLDFDRTRWGAIYGSGKFFQRLAMHLVNDLISLQVKIATRAH